MTLLNNPISLFECTSMTKPVKKAFDAEKALNAIIRLGIADTILKTLPEKVAKLRTITDKKQRDKYKKEQLPAVTWSTCYAVDQERSIKNAQKHSGLICLDIDGVDPVEAKALVAPIPYTLAAFVSPSGDGLKVIVRCDGATVDTHNIYFQAIFDHYEATIGLKLDHSGIDISRLCYISQDADLYFTMDCQPFTLTDEQIAAAKEAALEKEKRVAVAPNADQKTDYEKCEKLVLRLEANRTSITSDYRSRMVVGSSLSGLGESGRSLFFRVLELDANYANATSDYQEQFSNWLKRPAKNSIGTFIKLAVEALPKEARTKPTAGTPPPPPAPPQNGTPVLDNEMPENIRRHSWLVPKTKMDFAEGQAKIILQGIKFDTDEFMALCRYLGFRRLEIQGVTVYVKIDGKVMERVYRKHIIDGVFKYLRSLPERIVVDNGRTRGSEEEESKTVISVDRKLIIGQLMNTQQTMLSEEKMLHLIDTETEYNFIKHTKDEAWFFFKNTAVVVDSVGVEAIPYEKLDGYLWRESIIQHDFKRDSSKGDFETFLENISGKQRLPNGAITALEGAEERKLAFRTILGYLMHSFFKTTMQGILLTDSSKEEAASGRSGKTLLTKAVGRMLNADEDSKVAVEINGKNFDPQNRFRYQQCSPDTTLIILNDLQKYFEAENLFNDVTEGIVMEQKTLGGLTRIWVKMVITSNKTMKLDGDSAQDRIIQCEVTQYYSKQYRPIHEFGKRLFDEWEQKDFDQFHTFMLESAMHYLAHGMKIPAGINLDERYILDRTNADFVEWWNVKVSSKELQPGQEYVKGELKSDFIKIYPDHENGKVKLSTQNFVKWLMLASERTPGFGTITKEMQRQTNGNSMIRMGQKALPTNTVTTTPVTPVTPGRVLAEDEEEIIM